MDIVLKKEYYCSIISSKMGTMFSVFQRVKLAFSSERFAVAFLLLLGFILRLRQYLTGRSLWLDEAMLALNIVNRDFAGLLQPLDYDQGAPIGFLLVEKIANLMLGDHEFVLRLFPFVAGVASLGLFYLLLRRTTSGPGLLTGLALFAAGPALIYYSSEVKQYVVDVTVTIGLLLIALPLFEKRPEKQHYIILGLAGVLVLWFSYPASFVLAGIGITLFIRSLEKREWHQIRSVLMLGVVWLANLALLYFSSLRGLSQNTFLLDYWQENFMPLPPWSDWGWFALVFRGLLQNQVGIYASAWLVFALVVLGFITLFLKHKSYASVYLLVFIFALFASALQLYPLGGRLSLFLAPLVIILISQAVDALMQKLPTRNKVHVLISLMVGAYLLVAPVSESLNRFINPKYFEHIRPSMAALSNKWREGDGLFVSNGAAPAFRFYAERYGLGEVIYQTSAAADYQTPINILSHVELLDGNPRVWILITHVYERKDINEKDYLLSYLDSIGDKIREYRKPGSGVYLFLYDLSL